MSRLLDTHCHLDAYPDPLRVLAAAEAASVDVIAVTETPEAYRRFRTRLGARSNVRVGIGLHPASRAAAAPGQLERFFRLATTADWLGEVGLDFPAGLDRREKTRQMRVFESILTHTSIAAKPMTVHSRGSAAEVVQLATQAGVARRVVLHWYSGPAATLDVALDANFWFSINPAMTRTNKGRALLARLPPEKVLCETDGPYCKVDGRPATPADVPSVATDLARTWGVGINDAWNRLAENARIIMTPQ